MIIGTKIRQKLSVFIVFTMILSFFATPVSQQVSAADDTFEDLIISEYIEGGSFNKAIELYNGTGNSIDLADYSLELYSGGESKDKVLTLSGTLADGEVYVITHPDANQEIKNQSDLEDNYVINFNGDDPLALEKNGVVIDSIGQTGIVNVFAKDVTLVRKDSVKTGDADATDAFDSSVEWDHFPKDTTSELGSHLAGGTTPDPDPEPVELSTIADARKEVEGTTVKVTGIATASFSNSATNLFIQDDTAGIIIRGDISAQPGDEVVAEGKLNSYHGMQQIEVTSSNFEITTVNKGIPAPKTLMSTDLTADNGETHEGMFAEFSDVKIDSVDSKGNFTATDSSGTFIVKPTDSALLTVGETYEILRGVIDYNFDEYKLVPRNGSDIIQSTFSVTANPSSGTVEEGTKVTLQTETEGGTIYYTMDGNDPTSASTTYTGPVEITTDVTIKAIVVKDGQTSEVATFTYTVIESAEGVSIHDIQGAGHTSPYEGMMVTKVEGVVTAKVGSNGFYMQEVTPDEDMATSEAIYVYKKNSSDIKAGDKVEVSGEVKEWKEGGYDDAKDLLTTQITASAINVLSSNNEIPAAIVIGVDRTPPSEIIEDDNMTSFDPETDGLDFYESLEGMYIEIPDAMITGPNKYDEVPVVVNVSDDQLNSRAGGIMISPEDYNPERMLIDVDGMKVNVKTGDMFDGSIFGNVSYDYSNFKIRPTGDFPSVIDGGTVREVTPIDGKIGDLTIASYNIENFHAGTETEKVEKIAKSIVTNLKTPDIIGLVEVQDNNGPTDDGTTDASESYQTIIKGIEEAGGPTYKFTDIAPVNKTDGGQPGGNIRVGFIYNPDRVTLVDKQAGDAVTAVDVTKDGLTHNPGRIDPTNEAFASSRKSLAAEFMFNDERVIVVANHFNSKRGDGAMFGADHPVVLGSEEQREKQATVINEFVTDVVTTVEDANVVVLGDLNDFEFAAPVNTLEGDVLTNMMEMLPNEERYTYIYQGNSQVLDHILVTNNLADRTMIDSVNINADFSEEDGRASDHDPVLAKLQFSKDVNRISGADRYQTAIEVSQAGWETSDVVVIARGDMFPDALAGAPLAYKYDAPILLTQQDHLNNEVKAEIKRLGANKVIILGGKSAISNYVEYQLKSLDVKVDRISGSDRFETAANIAAKLGGNPEKAILANAYQFADALSVASYAAQNGYPIVLSAQDELTNASSKALKNIDEMIVVGGKNAISEKVFNSFDKATRYSGKDRYETSAEIAKFLTPQTRTAVIATGDDFADALAGSVLAANSGAEILLVKKEEVPESILEAIEMNEILNFRVIGGKNAISEDVLNQLLK
ncbi:cell wall-binding repeat-containing protein [Bacillus sp. 2205SS5-2]|uniref:cell wall-binding repeat-containing protein n=1 Tax=Bacillus sp. 2205SS5-2 TaxID=3109031 RepID=UPI0030047118